MATTSSTNIARSTSPAHVGPSPIRRLDESLINRIAAGEIIHRPASALKELLENSLDAGATSIRVTVKDGGLKLLQILDNGCGIRKDDLPLLAARFATSKLSTFSDLYSLRTFGFRGEALASVSHVAHLSVVTKVKADSCAWKAHYADGVLTPSKPGSTSEPKPCAGNDGTTITVEDLFHSTPLRLSALRSSSDEHARILDVMTKYAIHNPGVSFVCKKASSASPDLSTPSGSSTPDTIKLLYGASVARELVHAVASSSRVKGTRHTTGKSSGNRNVEVNNKGKGKERTNSDDDHGSDHESQSHDAEEEVTWKAEAYATGVNYHVKKMVFLLFINNRLVESSRIKRAVEAVYNGILPKGTFPFVYLSLQIDPHSVDVNVHPTKREVHFLDEEQITQEVCNAIQDALVDNSSRRNFQYQTLLTGGILRENDRQSESRDQERENGAVESSSVQKKIYSQHKVRMSTQDRTLDSMIPVVNPSQVHTDSTSESNRAKDIKESDCILTSVVSLRGEIKRAQHGDLTEILKKHVFVGIVDLDRCLSLIQHSTKLYLVNHAALAEELFYQLGLRQFGNFGRFKLDPPPSLRALVSLAVNAEEGIDKCRLNKGKVADAIVKTIEARRDMLDEYFSLSINEMGEVETLPLLLKDYTPNLDKLPLFLMRLGPQVDWTMERECFSSFLRELAFFYVPGPLLPFVQGAIGGGGGDDKTPEEKSERWQIQHVLFPSMRKYLSATKTLLEQDVIQVASLPDLYRVFERC